MSEQPPAKSSLASFVIFLLIFLGCINAHAQVTTTIAGASKNNVPALQVGIKSIDMTCTPAGDIIYSDYANRTVRRIDHATGIVTTIAGTGEFKSLLTGTSAKDGTALTVSIEPYYVAVSPSGDIYFSESYLNRIRKLDPVTGQLTTVLGREDGGGGYSGEAEPITSTISLGAPAKIVFAADGDMYFAEWLNSRIRKRDHLTGLVTTVAGNGVNDHLGDGSAATSASLFDPRYIAVDDDENIYVSDARSNVIRKIDATSGIISVFAGTGTDADSGDGGPAANAEVSRPRQLLVKNGSLYITTASGTTVRRVDLSTGTIYAFAGNWPNQDFSEGIPALDATLLVAESTAGDANGNVFIQTRFSIRKVSDTGIINTIAGTRGLAEESIPADYAVVREPNGVVSDSHGNIYFSELENHRIRKIDIATSLITTVKDESDGLFNIKGLGIDHNDNLYVADHNGSVIRKILATNQTMSLVGGILDDAGYTGDNGPATTAKLNAAGFAFEADNSILFSSPDHHVVRRIDGSGIITTVAGNGTSGLGGNNGPATQAQLIRPNGIDVDADGNLFIADTDALNVRMVTKTDGVISVLVDNNHMTYTSDGRSALQNGVFLPTDVALHGTKVYISGAYGIFVKDLTTGVLKLVNENGSGFAGEKVNRSLAVFDHPAALTVDADGNLIVADTGNNRIRKIARAQQVISFPPLTFTGSEIMLTASSTSSLPLSYSSSDTDVAKVIGNKLVVVGAGTATITASHPGNLDWYPATPETQNLTVPARTTQTIAFAPLPELTLGDLPFPLSATSSSGLNVVYESKDESIARIENNTIVPGKLGTATIVARQAGDLQYEAATPVEHSFEVVSATAGKGIAVMISDVNRAPAVISTTGAAAEINGIFLFSINGPAGEELYSTSDATGTPELLVDLVAGVKSGSPSKFTQSGNLLYFAANASGFGQDLWYTDGTSTNTKKLNMTVQGTIRTVGKFGDGVLFKTYTDREYLFYADATLDEPRLLYEFKPHSGAWTPDPILETNGKAFLTGFIDGGWAPFVTDGTADGTVQLKYNEIFLETVRIGAVYNGSAYFVGNSWLIRSDGTPAGTVMLPGNLNMSYPDEWFQAHNGHLYFTSRGVNSQVHLWKADASDQLTLLKTAYSMSFLASIPDKMLFRVFPLSFGLNELWATDGTVPGTTQVTLLEYNGQAFMPKDGLSTGNRAIIIGVRTDNSEHQIWYSDGTDEGTVNASVLPEGSKVSSTSIVGTRAFIQTGVYPIYELHYFDASTSAHTIVPVPQVSNGSNPSGFIAAGDGVVFNAATGAFGGEVWASFGDESNTEGLIVSASGATNIGGGLSTASGTSLSLNDGTSGFEPWKSDGTKSGTVKLADLSSQPDGSMPGTFTEFNGKTYFRALSEPSHSFFETDGTSAGTINVGNILAHMEVIKIANGSMYFVASQWGGLKKSDGTLAGTVDVNASLVSIQFYTTGGKRRFGEVIGSTLYLFASDQTAGSELMKIDLTTDAVTMVKDLTPGFLGTELKWMQVFDADLYFMTTDTEGSYLWTSDGTVANTKIIKSFDGVDFTSDVINFGDRFYFSAKTSEQGVELWSSQGTELTTKMMTEFAPGPKSSSPSSFFVTHDRLLFSIYDNSLWQITVGNLNPHQVELGPELDYRNSTWNFFEYGDLVLFAGHSPRTGTELWALDFRSENLPLEFIVGNKTYGDPDFTLTAYFQSGTDVVYSSSNEDLVSIVGNTARIVGAGSLIMSARVAGTSTVKSSKLETIVTVAKATQLITFNTVPAKTFGTIPFELVATSSASLPVSFTSLNTSRLTVSDHIATIVGAGSVDVVAMQAGNNNYHPAEVTQTLVIEKANQSISFPLIAARTIGDPSFTLGATSNSNLPITYTPTGDKIIISNSNLTLARAGRAIVTASQPGNDNYNAAPSVQQTFCINPVKPLVAANGLTTPTPVLTSSSDTDNQWYKDAGAIAGATNKLLNVTASGTYTVVVRVDDCVSVPSDPVNIVIVGDIAEPQQLLELYPNPASHELVVRMDRAHVTATQVVLMDLFGRTLELRELDANMETRFDLRSYQDGMYLVKVGTQTRKVQILK